MDQTPKPLPPPRSTSTNRWRLIRRQLSGRSPFEGSIKPTRVPLFAPLDDRPALPFPHPWNYTEPLRILETFFTGAETEEGPGRHSRYLDVPGFTPVLVTRDPALIKAISTQTGDGEGMFDRDTLPSSGIARATGEDTLLYANGAAWKRQKKLAAPPFSRASLYQPEQFRDFAHTFRDTVRSRLGALKDRIEREGPSVRVQLEPEIKTVMLEMLVNNFFGASVPYQEIRERFVPSIDRVIEHIVFDTVANKLGVPLQRLPSFLPGIADARRAREVFEELTEIAISPRSRCVGQWKHFKSDATDAALRSNVRVFLAGALEATTSYASWALAHLARHPEAQQRAYDEARAIDDYTPEALEHAPYINQVLNETLRLTPSLYFHPRRPTADTWVETSAGRLMIPRGTHILLDIWHANRHEDHWGTSVTGYRAAEFHPDRWAGLDMKDHGAKDLLHFGFGHGPRFCPGKNLGQLEVALVVGACVKLFELTAVNPENVARAGVSTKPLDGVLVDLRLRPEGEAAVSRIPPGQVTPAPAPSSRCPFATRSKA